MPLRTIYRPQANTDLDDIFSFILNNGGSADSAYHYVERIRAFCDSLVTFPHRGTKRDDIRPGLRLTGFERRVTIAFTVEEDRVLILRLFYAGRDIDMLNDEF